MMTDNDIKKNLDYYSDYFECMFWADINSDTENYNGNLDYMSIDKPDLIRCIEDLDAFFEKANAILENTDYTHAQACHDFYLTRCGHGCGFWEYDHCDKEAGDKLTEISKEFGTIYISIDNDTIYIG